MDGYSWRALQRELEQEREEEYPLDFGLGEMHFQVVSRFPRYSRSIASLPVPERGKIDLIARSLVGGRREPIRTIRLIGHADLDMPRRPAFEYQIALARAHAVRMALMRTLDRVSGVRALPPYSSRVAWEVRSAGATRPIVPNASTEPDRSRNRRVEISLIPYRGSVSRGLYVRGARFGFAPVALPQRLQAAIDDFCKRAPNDLVNRCNCVQAVGVKAIQLCNTTDASYRGGIPCQGPLTFLGNPRAGGRCYSVTTGVNILDGKDYRAPIIPPIRCCDWRSNCRNKMNKDCVCCRELGEGHYLVLKYKPEPLKSMVERLKCLLDRGCVVPVGVLSGTCDDKPDVTCTAAASDRWRDCWEHWLLVIGYDGDTFVFWDSAESSAIKKDCTQQPCKPVPSCPTKITKGPFCGVHSFGVLFYDSKNHRFSTANTDPSFDGMQVTGPTFPHDPAGFHTQGFENKYAQKRYQVVSMWPGLPWKAVGRSCDLG